MPSKRKKTRANKRKIESMTQEIQRRARILKAQRRASLKERGFYQIGTERFYDDRTL